MKKKETGNPWRDVYLRGDFEYPCEYVIRMLKGTYPRLKFGDYTDKSIIEVGYGSGREFPLFDELGFKYIAGTEITEQMVDTTKAIMEQMGIDVDLRVGKNNELNFDDKTFDYMLSWNVCYYMDDKMDFSSHVKEYARVLKENGILIFSIPMKSCFIYKDGIEHPNGFMEITSDPFGGVRNGTLQRVFNDESEIENAFGEYFKDFVFGSIHDDCFGLAYDWYIGYCVRK